MNRRIVSLNLMLTFLLFALVATASAQTRTVGVSVGNNFKHSVSVSWSSNDPTATPSQDLVNENDTQWMQLNVTAISGTNITGQLTTHYRNGTETINGGSVDVNTGASENLTTSFIISANLAAGDSLYNSSQFNTVTINETVPRTYSGSVTRDTNHLNVTSSGEGLSEQVNLYWDKSTGILVEVLIETVNQTAAYTTTSSLDAQIISSDIWTVPEFPNWTLAMLTLIALTSAIIIIARQKRLKRPLP